MTILQRLRTLEAWLLSEATLDRWQQETYDMVLDVLGNDAAAACLCDIQAGHWLQVGLLVGTISTGAPPSELEREFRYYRNTSFIKIPHTLQAIEDYLAAPAGRERYINVHYAFRHEGRTELVVQQALGRSWLTATGDPPALWDSLDADDQYQAWWSALVAMTWFRADDRRIFGGDPEPSRAAVVSVAECGIAVVREWLRWSVENSQGARGAVYHCTGRWPALVPDPGASWAQEIVAALAAAEERALYAE